jgi:phage terminase large subunit
MPHLQLPEKLQKLLTTDKRFKLAIGGRGGGKSIGAGSIFLMKAQIEGAKTLCLRELQNSIDDSVHALLREQIDNLALTGFEVTDKAIRHNGEDMFKFKGLARNPDAVKSMHGFKYAWGEEAQVFSERSIQLLTPTLRVSGSEIWLTLNPGSSADPVSQRFLQPWYNELLTEGIYEDDQHLVVWVNYEDNPWFPEELEEERKWDFDNLPRSLYDHIWRGHYLDEVEGSIITPEWFDACIDAHIKLGWKAEGARFVSHDPSDSGPDAKGLAYRHGSVVLDATEYNINDVNAGMDWATNYARQIDADFFIWDCDGLGVSLRRQAGEAFAGTQIEFQEFKGSMAVDNPLQAYDRAATGGKPKSNQDTFKNKRSQYWWTLRDKMYNTYLAVTQGKYCDPADQISLSSGIKKMDKLRTEVCRVPLHPNNNGLIQMMSKPDMKRLHKIESPNMGDSLMMSYAVKPTMNDRQARKRVNIPTIKSRRMSR